LSLIVEFNEGWDARTKIEVEGAVRQCIAEPPPGEHWIVSLAVSFPHCCDVRIKTPNQARARFFFEDSASLAQAITDWIKLYPLR
jgi:hypothetical protein